MHFAPPLFPIRGLSCDRIGRDLMILPEMWRIEKQKLQVVLLMQDIPLKTMQVCVVAVVVVVTVGVVDVVIVVVVVVEVVEVAVVVVVVVVVKVVQ